MEQGSKSVCGPVREVLLDQGEKSDCGRWKNCLWARVGQVFVDVLGWETGLWNMGEQNACGPGAVDPGGRSACVLCGISAGVQWMKYP